MNRVSRLFCILCMFFNVIVVFAECVAPDEHRLASQASFGANTQLLASIRSKGISEWVEYQLNLPLQSKQINRTIGLATSIEPDISWFGSNGFNPEAIRRVQHYQYSAWWQDALTAEDQLRQRVAFALSQIWVVSINAAPLQLRAEALASYQDLLLMHAFGNYRTLMHAITLSPAMGVYLSHQGNQPGNPDENYARELLQLFTLGVSKLNQDGSPIFKDNKPEPAYSQKDVMELARVFTGWDLVGNTEYGKSGNKQGNYLVPMEFNKKQHDTGEKEILNRKISSGLNGPEELEKALDIIFEHPNLPPFISKQLIQKLVTANPTNGYVERIANVFVDNGKGIRGDLKAVIKEILLDREARAQDFSSYLGNIREPLLWFSGLLRLLDVSPAQNFSQGQTSNVTEVYWFKSLGFGQDALRSPSVFNFYEPDYQPPDRPFSNSEITAPESSLLTPSALVEMDKLLNGALNLMDIRSWNLKGKKRKQNAKEKLLGFGFHVSLDTKRYLDKLELLLDGDVDGRFKMLEELKVPISDEKLNFLRVSLGQVVDKIAYDLTGCAMSGKYRGIIVDALHRNLIDKISKRQISDKRASVNAHRVISMAIRMVAMSPQYWIKY